jgi:hypothetical protein
MKTAILSFYRTLRNTTQLGSCHSQTDKRLSMSIPVIKYCCTLAEGYDTQTMPEKECSMARNCHMYYHMIRQLPGGLLT